MAKNRETDNQGPVVQSIVSLMTSTCQAYADYIIKYTGIFCCKNVRILILTFFKQKITVYCNINVLNFNERLTNDVVNF